MLNPDDLLDQIRRTVDHPATVRELLERLGWPHKQRTTLRRRLAVLVERGDLIRIRGHRYGLPDRMHLVTGRVQVHPRGFGFVTPDHPVDDLAGDVMGALHQVDDQNCIADAFAAVLAQETWKAGFRRHGSAPRPVQSVSEFRVQVGM